MRCCAATGTHLATGTFTLIVGMLVFKSMWNTIGCERASFSGAFDGATETHWDMFHMLLIRCEIHSQYVSLSLRRERHWRYLSCTLNPQGTNWVSVTQANFESGAICRGPTAAPPTKGGGECLGYHMSKSQLAALFDVQCLCYSETKIEVGYFSPSLYWTSQNPQFIKNKLIVFIRCTQLLGIVFESFWKSDAMRDA